MDKTVKMLLAGLAVFALSASVYANDGGGHCGHSGHGGWMDQEDTEKMHERYLTKLHDKLKLSAQQETAWKKFTAAPAVADKKAAADSEDMDKLNAPQRLEKGLERMRAVETKLADHLKALKEFYAVLTPEQQKTFDEQVRHNFGHHKHWGGHDD